MSAHSRYQRKTGGKLEVFISYSRRGLEFAGQLVAALEWQGFLPTIGRMRAGLPRCLTLEHCKRFYLPPAPPRWCFTMRKWPYGAATLAAGAAQHTALP